MPTSDPPAPVEMNPSVTTENPILSMAPQPTGLGSDANAAYEKFANMDQFDLVSKAPEKNRENPFDLAPASVEPAPTLSSMKASQGGMEKKEIMKSSMVVSSAQQGNWGGYGTQPGMGQTMGNFPQQPSMMSQGFGQQTNNGMNSYGQPNNGMNSYGQQPNNGMNSSMPLNNGQMSTMGNVGNMAGQQEGQQPQFNYSHAAPTGYGEPQQPYYGGQAQGF